MNSEENGNLKRLMIELEYWETYIPQNNMGKWARQVKIDNIKAEINKLNQYESKSKNGDDTVC